MVAYLSDEDAGSAVLVRNPRSAKVRQKASYHLNLACLRP